MLTSSNELLKQKGDHLLSEVSAGFQQQPQPMYTAPSNDEGLDQAERILPRLQVFLSLNSRFYPLQKDCWSRFSAKATRTNNIGELPEYIFEGIEAMGTCNCAEVRQRGKLCGQKNPQDLPRRAKGCSYLVELLL
ncbi:unnamed protein product [Fusarium graminearum]|nr:unnamed protein product [Fusarium graminearum]